MSDSETPATSPPEVLAAYLAGVDVPHDTLRPALQALRAAGDEQRALLVTIDRVYGRTADTLQALSARAGEYSAELFEAWHQDPFVHGCMVGEGMVWEQTRDLLQLLADAMRLREGGT